MTKEELKAAILELNEKRGHVPSRTELSKLAGVSRQQIRKHFGTYSRVLRECNLSAMRGGMRVDLGLLFRDWAELVGSHTSGHGRNSLPYMGRPSIWRGHPRGPGPSTWTLAPLCQ